LGQVEAKLEQAKKMRGMAVPVTPEDYAALETLARRGTLPGDISALWERTQAQRRNAQIVVDDKLKTYGGPDAIVSALRNGTNPYYKEPLPAQAYSPAEKEFAVKMTAFEEALESFPPREHEELVDRTFQSVAGRPIGSAGPGRYDRVKTLFDSVRGREPSAEELLGYHVGWVFSSPKQRKELGSASDGGEMLYLEQASGFWGRRGLGAIYVESLDGFDAKSAQKNAAREKRGDRPIPTNISFGPEDITMQDDAYSLKIRKAGNYMIAQETDGSIIFFFRRVTIDGR
jgi:hypothetical protein